MTLPAVPENDLNLAGRERRAMLVRLQVTDGQVDEATYVINPNSVADPSSERGSNPLSGPVLHLASRLNQLMQYPNQVLRTVSACSHSAAEVCLTHTASASNVKNACPRLQMR